jgi:pyruvate dehydrogenase (quinone)
MATTAADLLIDTIHRWGVEVVFGLPGDGILGIVEALQRRRDEIRFIHVKHEEAAALMACGYAKFTGKIGVCLGTSGPGGVHLLNGLYDAKLDGQPVLALTGNQFHDLTDTYGQQDVPLDRLFADVAVYNTRIMGPNHVENAANLACRTAITQRGPTHITFPVDLQSRVVKGGASLRNLPHHTASLSAQRGPLPYEGDLRQAVEILNSGKKVVILAGRGALGASAELEFVSEILGAPIVKAFMGKAAVPDDSPNTTGGLGPLGTAPSRQVMQSCDTLLLVGTSFPYVEYLPKPGKARAIQIDIDPKRIGLRYPIEVGLIGDAQRTLKEFLPLLAPNQDRRFLEKAQESMREWFELMEKRAVRTEKPLKPQTVAWELSEVMDENAIISCDIGAVAAWWARQIRAKRGQMHAISGNMASMGSGLPYAIAAQIAFPDRTSVSFQGDGGFSMFMAEFTTCVKYQLPVKVIVIKDQDVWQSKGDYLSSHNSHDFDYASSPIDFSMFAKACGATGLIIDDPAHCRMVLEQAFATPGPVLVEARVDTKEKPVPADWSSHA